jgi:hypothetical protein
MRLQQIALETVAALDHGACEAPNKVFAALLAG